jgi:hypothetical protein
MDLSNSQWAPTKFSQLSITQNLSDALESFAALLDGEYMQQKYSMADHYAPDPSDSAPESCSDDTDADCHSFDYISANEGTSDSGNGSNMAWHDNLDLEIDLYDFNTASWGHREHWPFSWSNSPWYWIDAICINQTDEDEKMNQIALMGEIYTQANMVTAWLGKDDRLGATALAYLTDEFLRDLCDSLMKLPDSERRDKFLNDFDPLAPSLGNSPQYDPAFCGGALWTTIWGHYHNFIQKRTWFKRVWVMQEVALARRVQLLSHLLWITWERFCALEGVLFNRQWFASFQTQSAMQHTGLRVKDQSVLDLLRLRNLCLNKSEDPPSSALFMAIAAASHRSCTLPEDRVYGILSILNASGCHEIVGKLADRPRQMIQNLYMDVSMSLYQGDAFEILRAASGIDSVDVAPDLPSWALDLKAVAKQGKCIVGDFEASGKVARYVKRSKNALRLRGIRLGMVQHFAIWGGVTKNSLASCLLHLHRLSQPSQHQLDWLGSLLEFLEMRTASEKAQASTSKATEDFASGLHAIALIEMIITPGNASIESLRADWQNVGKLLFSSHPVLQNKFSEAIEGAYCYTARLSDIENQRNLLRYMNATVNCSCGQKIMAMEGRTFFLTDSGHLGIASAVQLGDTIWLIAGLAVPLVLRVALGQHKSFVSDTYLDGVMYGELAGQLELQGTIISLV